MHSRNISVSYIQIFFIMGNYFSQLFDDFDNDVNKIIAPAAQYTISPSTQKISDTSEQPEVSNAPDETTSPDTSDEKCVKPNPGSTTTTQTTILNTPLPENQLNRNDEDDENKFMEFIKTIFNATTYTIIFWIITAYMFYLLGKSIYVSKGIGNENSGAARYSRTIDLVMLFLTFGIIFNLYYKLEEEDKSNIVGYTVEQTQDYFNNPWSLFGLIWFTIIFFALVYILKVPMGTDAKPILVHFIEHKIWVIYAIFAIIYFFKYALGIPVVDLLFNNSIMDYFKNVKPYSSSSPSVFNDIQDDLSLPNDIYNNQPSTTTTTPSESASLDNLLDTSPEAQCVTDKQVFNVSNNLYTYEEAQKVCTAFDASLANYDQIEKSYENGGEWCNYGWSDGQMAYFPTQKQTWEDLQENPKTKNICGRPGINGGFIDNPYVRFGANCYGIKPEQPDNWNPVSYVTDCGIKKEDPNKKIREEARLNSFNQKNWSRY